MSTSVSYTEICKFRLTVMKHFVICGTINKIGLILGWAYPIKPTGLGGCVDYVRWLMFALCHHMVQYLCHKTSNGSKLLNLSSGFMSLVLMEAVRSTPCPPKHCQYYWCK